MEQIKRLFTEHPASVGENYLQHLGSAWYFAWQMTLGAANCFIHGLFPFLFEKTGSGRVAHLHDRMIVNRSRLPADPGSDSPRVPLSRSRGATDIHNPAT